MNVSFAPLEKLLQDCKDLHARFNFTALNALKHNSTEWEHAATDLIRNVVVCRERNRTTVSPQTTESWTADQPHPVLILYFVIVAVFGLAINLSVIGTICRVRRLWTITNAFVISLAMADFLMAIVLIPLNIYVKYTHDPNLGVAKDTVITLLGVASLLNLAAVTFERFMSISYPLTYDAYLNRCRATFVITVVWFVSIFQAFFRLAFKDEEADRIYEIIQFSLAVAFPFLCILIVNIKIYYVARQHVRQINASTPEGPSRIFNKKLKIVKIITLLVGTFTLTWIPYWIQNIFEHHNPEANNLKVAEKSTEAVVCSAALLNPLLYGLLRKDVREAILRGLRCQNVNQTETESFSHSLRTEHTPALTSK